MLISESVRYIGEDVKVDAVSGSKGRPAAQAVVARGGPEPRRTAADVSRANGHFMTELHKAAREGAGEPGNASVRPRLRPIWGDMQDAERSHYLGTIS